MVSKTIMEKLFLISYITVNLFFGIVCGADLSYMENNLRNYFSKTRHHDVNQTNKDRTMNFIRDEFVRFGLETELQVFPDPRVSNTTNFTNVIGILKGERFGQLSDRILGVGAHYDTVSTTPGVDDNGAAVAAMLETARQLTEKHEKGTKRQNTMIFVSFDIEEEGLFGSQAFVNQWFTRFLRDNYGPQYRKMKHYGVIVMDVPMLFNDTENSQTIIGPNGSDEEFARYFPDVYTHLKADNFRGDFIALIYRNGSADTELAHNFRDTWNSLRSSKFELESYPVPVINVSSIWMQPVLGNFLRSDHTRFWLKDFPAIFLSDTANFRSRGSSCYHRACDSIDIYVTDDNMKFLGKTADSMTRTLDKLSEPHASSSGACGIFKMSALVYIASLAITVCVNTS